MDYLLIPVKDKAESDFFVSLLKKMRKDVSTISDGDMEDMAFMAAIKEGEKTGMGSLAKIKAHLSNVATGK